MSTSILKAVWGTQSGFVFVPRRKPVKGGKDKWEEGKAYKYPEEWEDVKKHVTKSTTEGWDTYWCPLVFTEPRRIKECVKPKQGILWADLDFVDPTKLGALRPSIAWKSSDERYQGLWALSNMEDIKTVESVNRDLTYKIGADKGGWDVTQVLRVPGSYNYKYDPPQKGKLLWAEKKSFVLDKVAEVVKFEASKEEEPTDSVESLIKDWKIPTRTKDLLFVDEREVEVGERSDRLWEIETSLLDAGLPILTVVKVISLCPWNKFKGRKGEMEQIYHEVLKADEYIKDKHRVPEEKKELDPEAKKLKEQLWAIPFDKFVSKSMEPPSWLVEGIWQKGTYGMIAGEPKTYKSVQATDLALSVATGRPFLNCFKVKTQGSVLYVQEENGEQTVQDRVHKVAAAKGLLTSTPMGWSLPEDIPIYFCNNYGINLTEKGSRELLEQTIRAINPVLVILDPLYMMLGSVDENSAKEVGGVLQWLTYIRNTYKCSLLICHHYNKGSNNARGGQRVRGTSAFHAWVESALYVSTTTEEHTVSVEREFRAFPSLPDYRVKIDLGEPSKLYYRTKIEYGDLKAKVEVKKLKEVVEELRLDEVYKAISEKPMGVVELAKETKLSEGCIKATLGALVDKGKIFRYGGTRGTKYEYRVLGVEEIEDDDL